MKKKIFICYRRDDSEGYAGRLYDRLVQHFPERVFMDTASIPAGADFVAKMREVMRESFAALVIIGPRWLAAGEDGVPRLKAAGDHVRLEIVEAFRNELGVIPVLVQGSKMPRQGELPRGTATLTHLNAVEVRHTAFDADFATLVRVLKSLEETRSANPTQPEAADS
jgi:hypothetical protein